MLFVSQRQFVIPTALPAVGVQGAGLVDENNGEVHVYAHPSKVVNNLQHPKEREKVWFILSPIFFFYTYGTFSSMLQSNGLATACFSCAQSIQVQGSTSCLPTLPTTRQLPFHLPTCPSSNSLACCLPPACTNLLHTYLPTHLHAWLAYEIKLT